MDEIVTKVSTPPPAAGIGCYACHSYSPAVNGGYDQHYCRAISNTVRLRGYYTCCARRLAADVDASFTPPASDVTHTSAGVAAQRYVDFKLLVRSLTAIPRRVRQQGLVCDVWCRLIGCLLYTSPSPRDGLLSRMPSSA